jgi:general secretion pathway protein J
MEPKSRAQADSAAGFTLAEVLVSLAILGLMLVLLFSNVRFEARAWQAATLRSDRASELDTVTHFMRRQLGEVYPRYDEERKRLEFDGRPAAMRFLAPVPAFLASGGIQEIAYFVAADREQRRLVMSRAPLRPLIPIAELSRLASETTLIEGVEAVEFAYFGKLAEGREPQWFNQWTDATALPALIRVRVRFPGGDGRVWPDLYVKPTVALDAVCVYDARQRRCRGRE